MVTELVSYLEVVTLCVIQPECVLSVTLIVVVKLHLVVILSANWLESKCLWLLKLAWEDKVLDSTLVNSLEWYSALVEHTLNLNAVLTINLRYYNSTCASVALVDL